MASSATIIPKANISNTASSSITTTFTNPAQLAVGFSNLVDTSTSPPGAQGGTVRSELNYTFASASPFVLSFFSRLSYSPKTGEDLNPIILELFGSSNNFLFGLDLRDQSAGSSGTFEPGSYRLNFFNQDSAGSTIYGQMPSQFASGTVNLRLDPAAVPEPAGWALMIGGFGLVGATMRRRRGAPALV